MVRAFLVLVTLAIASAAHGEDVGVRGWSHAKFGRLVFDWPVAVTYTARISGRRLTVNFNKPISTQFAPALQNLREYINDASISRNGRTVGFSLAGDFALRSFKNDNAIVLDLRRIKNKQNQIKNNRTGFLNNFQVKDPSLLCRRCWKKTPKNSNGLWIKIKGFSIVVICTECYKMYYNSTTTDREIQSYFDMDGRVILERPFLLIRNRIIFQMASGRGDVPFTRIISYDRCYNQLYQLAQSI